MADSSNFGDFPCEYLLHNDPVHLSGLDDDMRGFFCKEDNEIYAYC